MANELERIYLGSDAYMVQTSRTIRGLFIADKADFIEFDPQAADPMADTWLEAIDAADAVVRDAQVQDVIEAQTDTVVLQMKLCRRKFAEVKYFAGKVFAENKPVMDEFGNEDYRKARNRQGKLIELMGILGKAADKYKTRLIDDGGYTQARIDEIATLRTALQTANTDQDVAIKGRPVLTNERIKTLNHAYYILTRVNEAAQIVFEDDPTKAEQYVYNPTPPTPPTTLIVKGKVTDAVTDAPVQKIAVSLTHNGQGYTVQTTASGNYVFTIPDLTAGESGTVMVQVNNAAGYQGYSQPLEVAVGHSHTKNVALQPV